MAVIQVLDGKRKPMTPNEILAEITDRRLAKKLAGKTPEASVAARLAVHAAKGLYVERPEKGKYQLKKGVTAKSLASISDSKATTRTKTGGLTGSRTPASRGRRQSPRSKPAQQPAASLTDDEATSTPTTPAPEVTATA